MYCLCLTFGLFSCQPEKDQVPPNELPTVRISIDSIGLPDTSSLATRVKLSWVGTEKDGYIRGFQISWSTNAKEGFQKLFSSPIVKNTDSTFLFNFTGGAETALVHFFIRSLDNEGKYSQIQYLKIPVKNSTPSIQFLDDGMPLADTIWSVLSIPYRFSDPDGSQNVDSVFIRINEGKWVALPKNLGFISLVPVNPGGTESNCLVYAGENLAGLTNKPSPIPNMEIPGLKLNEGNVFYLQVKDQAGAIGLDTSAKKYYVKQKTGSVLVVNAFNGVASAFCDTLYSKVMNELGIGHDKINLIQQNGINQPRFWDAQFYLLCQLYGKVFWFGDVISSAPGAIPLLLNPASAALKQHLRFDGKLLGSNPFPDAPFQLPKDDGVFDLVPIDTFTRFSNNVRIRPQGTLQASQAGFEDLTTGRLLTGGDIFKVKPGVDSLYFVPKNMMASQYTGPGMPIALRTRNAKGKTNLVFFTIEMAYLNGNRPALVSTFNKILNDEFNW